MDIQKYAAAAGRRIVANAETQKRLRDTMTSRLVAVDVLGTRPETLCTQSRSSSVQCTESSTKLASELVYEVW